MVRTPEGKQIASVTFINGGLTILSDLQTMFIKVVEFFKLEKKEYEIFAHTQTE